MCFNRFIRNPEVKKTIIGFIFILIISMIVNIYVSKMNITNLNKEYIKQNTYIAGKLKNIGVDENEIIKCFTQGGSEEEYKIGKDLLKLYSYTEDTDYEKVPTNYKIFNEKWSNNNFIIFISLTMLFLVVCRILWNIYKYINEIIGMSNNFVEERFEEVVCNNKEGDLALLNFEFNTMGKRIKEGIEKLQNEKEQLRDYLSDISHQLKTPLSSLIMFNQIMLSDLSMESNVREQFLIQGDAQLNKMEWLILNLLKIGRLEADVINMNKEEQPIIYTIKNSINNVKHMADNKKQKIYVDCSEEASFEHDMEWLGEALTNIIKNCIEHTRENGVINVKVEDNKLYTCISIEDNGEGMTKDQKNNIFKRFYKGENSTNPTSIGIGMSLSKAIIEKNSGFIKVDSKVGKGTTFIITFYKGAI